MNKLTAITVVVAAALLLGMMTPDSGLLANATGKNNTSGDNHNDQNKKDKDRNYDHDDDCHDDHDKYARDYDHDDEHNDDHDDDCHDDDNDGGETVNDPPTVKVYKVVINNEGNSIPIMASFGINLNNTQVTTNGTLFTVAPNKPIILTESGLTGYVFVEIRGDGHCPENLGGTITLDNGQHIECYIVNQPINSAEPITPGVIFHYNTLEFNWFDPSVGDSCSAPGKTAPCVELANVHLDRSILVVDDELKTDTTIVLFSVVEDGKINQNPPQFATSPLCALSGMGPHTTSYAQEPDIFPVTNPTDKMGFEFQCSLVEAESFKVSYALIETKQQ